MSAEIPSFRHRPEHHRTSLNSPIDQCLIGPVPNRGVIRTVGRSLHRPRIDREGNTCEQQEGDKD